MLRHWVLASVVFLPPVLAFADEQPLIPVEFPQRVGGFWWEESVASARSRCDKFLPASGQLGDLDRAISFVCLSKNGSTYRLNFDSKTKKLATVGFKLAVADYQQCEREVAELIRSGPQLSGDELTGTWRAGDRSENNGHEDWSVGYGIYSGGGSEMIRAGLMVCDRQFEGCADPDQCLPTILFIYGPPKPPPKKITPKR